MKKKEYRNKDKLVKKKQFYFHKSAHIEQNCQIGKDTKIWHFSHIQSGSKIGNNCTLGQNTYVGDKVIIGNNVKIQNNVSLFQGVSLDDNVFCGPSVVFTNVINPRSEINRKDEYKKTIVEKGVSLGANSTILCGIKLSQYAFIAAGAVVTKSVGPFELVAGVPAKRIGWVSKYGIRMRLGKKRNSYVCKFTGSKYILKNNKVSIEK